MRLHDQGRLDVEAPVRDYLPGFALADDDAARTVKVWHLMTHTPGWEGQLDTADRGPATSEHFVESLRTLPQHAPPGEVWAYNNAGWGVAGRIIEVLTEQNIGDALHELVFEPLGLDRACASTGLATSFRFAAPHTESDGGETIVQRPFTLPVSVAAGGCAMSVENLLSYARFHLGDGTIQRSGGGTERLLSEGSLLQMRTARVAKNASSDEMGLGWHLRSLNGVLTCQHGVRRSPL